MSFPQYPEYKDSGVEWLGDVPAHWEVPKLKHLVRIRNGRDYKAVEVDSGGYPVIGSGGEFSRADSYLYKGKSVLLGRKGTIDKPLYIDGPFWTVDTMFYTELTHNVDGRFLFHYASCFRFDQYSTNTALPSMAQEDLANIRLAVPEVDEQASIAAFLDHETARIDALIGEQKRLIELLREKRRALISHAVTKGLDPDVPMKESGVEWLGEVPAHWIVAPIKIFYKFLDGKRIPLKSEDRGSRQGLFPYYGASGVIDWIDDYIFDQDHILVSEDGANLLARSSPISFVAKGKYWVNNHAHILSPIDNNLVYWAEVIENLDLAIHVTGSAQPKLTSEALGSIMVASPPLPAERLKIQEMIFKLDKVVQELINEAVEGIKLLKERRSALISAAVTGKIDVRSWQPGQAGEQSELSMVAESRATYR
ncbi:restriction endonuclease subunit S [Vreelandella sp. TE19]